MGKTIFLSHASKDRKLVEYFVDFLQIGLNLNSDEIYCTSFGDIQTGHNFVDSIKANITINTKYIIFLMTPNYFNSYFCLSELGAAWALNHNIYPIIVPPLDYNILNNTPLLGTNAIMLNNKEHLFKMCQDFGRSNISRPNLVRFSNKVDIFLVNLPNYLPQDDETKDKLISRLKEKEIQINELISEASKLEEIINKLIDYNSSDQDFIESLTEGAEKAIRFLEGITSCLPESYISSDINDRKLYKLTDNNLKSALRGNQFIDHEWQLTRIGEAAIMTYRKYLKKKALLENKT